MMKYPAAVILVLFFSTGITAVGQSPPQKQIALRDGFVIDGIDGKISSQGENWYFAVFESLTDGQGVLATETAVQILPSSMLIKLAAAVSTESKNFRIWGKFTKYRGRNFIYLSYFLPVTEVNQPQVEPADADANEEKIIPDDVLALLRPKRMINLAELKKPLSTESDGIIADRTGFLVQEGNDFYFDFDALGRNIDSLQLPLLNCESLEVMANQQSLSTIPMRFKISAIVTAYKGKNYMLLQRATRAYNHGNFAR
jgi:hypothetical protein